MRKKLFELAEVLESKMESGSLSGAMNELVEFGSLADVEIAFTALEEFKGFRK